MDGPSSAGLQPIVFALELAWFHVDLLLNIHQGSDPEVEQLVLLSLVEVLGFCLYPINPGRFSSQYHTGADRCTPTLPRWALE